MVERAYLVICGTTTAFRAPELIEGLGRLASEVITLMTPGAARVVSPRTLVMAAGHRLVESYFDEAILPRPSDGPVLVAPCSFNSLNKLAGGIADSLALSVTADMIGRGLPVVVALSVNRALWDHPRTAQSIATLRDWGISVIEPVLENGEPTLAPSEVILGELGGRLAPVTESPL